MSRGKTSKDHVLACLQDGPRTSQQLVAETGCTVTNVKAALLYLRDAGQITSKRCGRNVVLYELVESRTTLALLDVPWIKHANRKG